MVALLQTYSITEIIIFLVMFAIAFKSVVSFWDWLVSRLSVHFKKENEQALRIEYVDKKFEEIDEKIKLLYADHERCDCQNQELIETLNSLVDYIKDNDK